MSAIPTIETERLSLEPPNAEALRAHVAFYASPRSAFVSGPLTRELAWRAYAGEIGHWALRGFGRWAVRERASGAWVGHVGCWSPEGWPEPEIGWMAYEGGEGRGLIREAAEAARSWAYAHAGWTTAISLIAPDNDRSIALAERLGAWRDGDFAHERFGRMGVWRHPGPADASRAAA